MFLEEGGKKNNQNLTHKKSVKEYICKKKKKLSTTN